MILSKAKHLVTNNKLISTSQLPAGVLNTPMRERAHETFTLGGAESFMDVVNKLMRQSFGPGFTFVNREFTAICIQVLSNKETQRLMAASSPQLHYQRVAKTTDTQIPQACRVSGDSRRQGVAKKHTKPLRKRSFNN